MVADRRRQNWNKLALVLLMVVPGMALFTLFVLIPIAQSLWFSFYKWNGFGPPELFWELKNYEQLFRHKAFHAALWHTLALVVLSLTIQLPLAMGLALVVGRGTLPARRFFRLMLFVPYVFSEIITAIIWRYVLDPNAGLVNVVLGTLVPGYQPIAWLGEQNIVILAIFFVLTWKYFGFYLILYMAALQGIPSELEDAARIDGADERQVLWNVTLPMVGPTIRLSIFLAVLGSIQQFVIVWVMTQGGPVDYSETLGTYVFKYGIQRLQLGYGSAVAVVLFVITLVFSLTYQHFVLRRDDQMAR
jgi:raffinose/stachyose/melibiose transport system permease protein